MACALGLILGAHLKPANPMPLADLQDESLVQWTAPTAEAAEPAPDDSPPLYVKSGGRWISEAGRAAALTQAQDAPDAALAQAQTQDQVDVASAVGAATPEPWPAPPEQTAAEPDPTAQPGAPQPGATMPAPLAVGVQPAAIP